MTWLNRLACGLRRRAGWAWQAWLGRSAWPSFPATAVWLQQQGDRLVANQGVRPLRVGTWIGLLPVAHAAGLDRLAQEAVARLNSLQDGEGALPDDAQAGPSLWNTAQFVRAMLACRQIQDQPTLAACQYLRRRIDARGRLVSVGAEPPGTPFDPLTVRLAVLAGLAAGARRWSRPDWGAVVAHALPELRDQAAAAVPSGSEALIDRAEAWLDLNRPDEAETLLREAERNQRRDGLVPDASDRPGVTTAGLARLTGLWYRAGRRRPADRAMAKLALAQQPDGSLPAEIASRGRDEDDYAFHQVPAGCPSPRSTNPAGFRAVQATAAQANTLCQWHYEVQLVAAAALLQAMLEQVRHAFDKPSQFPEQIDPADGRAAAVADWLGLLPERPEVADVGCGRGRFLRLIARLAPEARLTGIDVSPAMLAQLPAEVRRCRGSLLRIPAADAAFDAAMAVESLEHSLWPQRAVNELCRIVRPGGRILIIDKHRDKQSRSLHDPWEQWFTPDDLRNWLSPYCDELRVVPVGHLEGRAAQDLFLAASARRR